MPSLNVNLVLPSDLLVALNVSEAGLSEKIKQCVAFELLREGFISTGKAADLLDISKFDFIQLLAHQNISYFTESPEELGSQVLAVEKLLNEGSL